MPTVLIVDDNPMDRTLAAACLEGIESVFAEDGRQALRLLKEQQPDLVLTDLDMPDVDGLELVQEIRYGYPSIPVVLMTAKGSEEIVVSALKTGAASYVPKRKMKTDLASTVDLVLTLTASRQQQLDVYQLINQTSSEFILGYDDQEPPVVVNHLQNVLRGMKLCDESDLLRAGTALSEAIANARDHGNLELAAAYRESGDSATVVRLAEKRVTQAPWSERKVHVTISVSHDQASIVVRDEGPGFDTSSLPDATQPESLSHGRGLMLIRSFMDEVQFNEAGNEITMIKRKPLGTV